MLSEADGGRRERATCNVQRDLVPEYLGAWVPEESEARSGLRVQGRLQ